MPDAESAPAVPEAPKKSGAVLRNTLILVGGQLAGVPLSILLSATTGRYLGADDFGYIYLAGTLTSFGFLLVEWGHGGVIAAAVARDRSRAGSLLGTTLLWRTLATVVVSLGLWVLAILLGYTPAFRLVLLVVVAQCFLNTVRAACTDVARGFERLEVSAYAQLGAQILAVLLVIPTLLLGGQLMAVLFAQLAATVLVSGGAWYALRSISKQPARVDRPSLNELFSHGSSFLLFGFVMALQPNIDAIFLSKLTTSAVLGWQAAAQRLMGLINMPASALGSALYPTLSRLYVEDREAYTTTVTRALQGTALLAIPAAISCALYRSVGAQLFGDASFAPVEQNLLVLSSLVFLLYFSMPLSVAILAAGKQRPFALVQTLCIIVSVVLDPLLIPWFQRRYGNGGLGVCVAGSVSEIAVLLASIPLMPRGIVTFKLAKSLGRAVFAGGVMIGVGMALGKLTPYVAAPIALAAYFGSLWLIGGIEPSQVEAVKALIGKKFARRRAQA
jgi:O-antigen/teichoic acid export membrane protein